MLPVFIFYLIQNSCFWEFPMMRKRVVIWKTFSRPPRVWWADGYLRLSQVKPDSADSSFNCWVLLFSLKVFQLWLIAYKISQIWNKDGLKVLIPWLNRNSTFVCVTSCVNCYIEIEIKIVSLVLQSLALRAHRWTLLLFSQVCPGAGLVLGSGNS